VQGQVHKLAHAVHDLPVDLAEDLALLFVDTLECGGVLETPFPSTLNSASAMTLRELLPVQRMRIEYGLSLTGGSGRSRWV
jgi:hypothetical protein